MRSDPGVRTVTFGCRLNIVESDDMRQAALEAGHRNFTIINTCAVTSEAARQSRQAVRRAHRERPGSRVVVTGCASETDPARFRDMPEVHAVLPNATKTAAATWQDIVAESGESAGDLAQPQPPRTRGFVDVQNGCDHRCTFCIIPFGRGASRSRPAAEVVDRVQALVAGGAQEVVLTGVDVTAYGVDLHGRPQLGQLVRDVLAEVPALRRLRLSSLDCIEADHVLLRCLADEARLMPHLHLSVQSGSDLILRRMKRRHRRADVLAFCAAVRARRPDVVFGADFIAGFPTETEAMFADTLDLIEHCGLTFLHAFPFSARPGTPAARMPPVSGDAIRARAAHLRSRGADALRQHLGSQIGRRLVVLTERGGTGHAEDFTLVRLPAGTPAGRLMPFVATGHDGRALFGRAELAPMSQSFHNHQAE